MRAQQFLAILSQSFLWDPSSPLLQPSISTLPGKTKTTTASSSSSSSSCRLRYHRRRCSPSFVAGGRNANIMRRRRESGGGGVDDADHRSEYYGGDYWNDRRSRFLFDNTRLHSSYRRDHYHHDDDDGDFDLSSKQSKRRRKNNINQNPSVIRPSSSSSSSSKSTMSTAVCIVPPDDAWDAIQRARHLARDTTFYKWPPAIRLFHPFAPKREIPSLVGRMAEWIEEEADAIMMMTTMGDDDEDEEEEDETMMEELMENGFVQTDNNDGDSPSSYLESFEVTLDSILILPHWEVLEARIEALERSNPNSPNNNARSHYLDESTEEKERRMRSAEGAKLIREEERMGLQRKRERERKRRLRMERKAREENGGGATETTTTTTATEDGTHDGSSDRDDATSSSNQNNDEDDDDDDAGETTPATSTAEKEPFNGPCVIYLSPDETSRARLETLREKLRVNLFPNHDAFSPSSSVSPHPERLPRRESSSSEFRPLLPVARFSSVGAAVKVAKVLQRTWDPLSFNVTDVQFVSREEEGGGCPTGVMDLDEKELEGIAEVRHRRRRHESSSSSSSSGSTSSSSSSSTSLNVNSNDNGATLALTSSGEVEDVSKQGIYGCDAMVMLLGEEPEEELMEEEASLSMIMDGDDDDNGDDGDANDDEHNKGPMTIQHEIDSSNGGIRGTINYDEIFATAEREYQRMQAHEELSAASYAGEVPIFGAGSYGAGSSDGEETTMDIEAWLDDDDDGMEDEGATVVIGRAQFFMGAMREFIGMPASSAIDLKDRIMGGGVSAVARRKGSVHRLAESWDVGDYGKKETDKMV